MRKLAILLVSFLIITSNAFASCGVGESGIITPASSEICPDDIAMEHVYKVFPTITKDAVNFFSLKNKGEYLQLMQEKMGYSKSSYAVERYIKYSAIIIFNIIKLVWVVQIVLVIAATLKDKKLGGEQYGAVGVVSRLSLGVLLFIPYGASGTIGTLILMGGYFLAIGLSNIMISMVAYFYQNWSPQISEDITTKFNGNTITTPRFVAEYSDALGRSFICYQHAELAYIKDRYVEGNRSVGDIMSSVGLSSETISEDDQSLNTSIVKNNKYKSVSIGLLPHANAKENGSLNCASIRYKISNPPEQVTNYIEQGGDDWSEMNQILETDIKSENGVVDRNAQQRVLSNMTSYFQTKMLESLYDDLDVTSEIAKSFAEVSRAKVCVSEPLKYTQSRAAILAIQSGGNPTFGFDLRCGKMSDGGIQLFTDVKKPYMNPKDEAYDESKDLLKKELSVLYRTYSDLQRNLFDKLIQVNAVSVLKYKEQHVKSSRKVSLADSDSLLSLRRYGLASYSMFFMTSNDDFEGINNDKLVQAAFSPLMKLTIDPTTMLPSSYVDNNKNNETIRDFSAMSLPYNVKSLGSGDSSFSKNGGLRIEEKNSMAEDTINQILSQLSAYSNSSGENSFEREEIFKVDTNSLGEGLIGSLSNASYHLKSFVNADFSTVSEGYIYDNETVFEAKQRFMKECLSGKYTNFSANEDMAKRCSAYQRHPILSAQEVGKSLIIYAFGVMLIQFTYDVIGKAIDNKYSKRKLASVKSNSSDKLDLGAAAMNTIVSSSVLGNIAFMLLVFGLFFTFILPLAPNVIFLMMYLGWLVYAVIIFILSPLLFMSFVVLKGKDEEGAFSEKNLINVAINFILKPVLIITSFTISWLMMTVIYRLTILLFGTYVDSMSSSVAGNFIYDFFIQVFTYVALLFALYKVMHWSFTKPPQVLNMLMDRLGGENIISREGAVNGVIGALGYGSMMTTAASSLNKVGEGINVITRKVGQNVGDTLMQSNSSFVKQQLDLSENNINVLSSEGVEDVLSRESKLKHREKVLLSKINMASMNTRSLQESKDKVDSNIEKWSIIIDELENQNLPSNASTIEKLKNKISQGSITSSEYSNSINKLSIKDAELHSALASVSEKMVNLVGNGFMGNSIKPNVISSHVDNVKGMIIELESNNSSKLNILGKTLFKSLDKNMDGIDEFLYNYERSLQETSKGGLSNANLPSNSPFSFTFNDNGVITGVQHK